MIKWGKAHQLVFGGIKPLTITTWSQNAFISNYKKWKNRWKGLFSKGKKPKTTAKDFKKMLSAKEKVIGKR